MLRARGRSATNVSENLQEEACDFHESFTESLDAQKSPKQKKDPQYRAAVFQIGDTSGLIEFSLWIFYFTSLMDSAPD